jgi:hypothetical protein
MKSSRFKWAELSLKFILDPQAVEDSGQIKSYLELIKNRQIHSVSGFLVEIYEELFNKHLPLYPTKRARAIALAERILSWIFVSNGGPM